MISFNLWLKLLADLADIADITGAIKISADFVNKTKINLLNLPNLRETKILLILFNLWQKTFF